MSIEALAKVRRLSRSLVVDTPKEIVEHEGIKDGDMLKVSIGKVKSGFGALPGIGSMTHEDELDEHPGRVGEMGSLPELPTFKREKDDRFE